MSKPSHTNKAPGEVTRKESAFAAITVVVDVAGNTGVHLRRLAKMRCHLSENNGHQRCRGGGCKSTRAIDTRRQIHANIQNTACTPRCVLSWSGRRWHTLTCLWQLASTIFPQQPMAKDLMESKPSSLFANSTLTPLTNSREMVKHVPLNFVGSNHLASHTKPSANLG